MNLTKDQIKQLPRGHKLSSLCKQCNSKFELSKSEAYKILRSKSPETKGNFCSTKCSGLFKVSALNVKCSNCCKQFTKTISEIKKSKNNFCSKSCSATYNNKHKTTGFTKSKAEIYLAELLSETFPDVTVKENTRDVLPSKLELDFFFPKLNFAIELNGPVHYFPIYGNEKLNKTIAKDLTKVVECQKLNILLLSVNISTLTYFPKTKKFLDSVFDVDIKPLILKLMCL